MAAATRARPRGDCLLHGRHHELGLECSLAAWDWYAAAYPEMQLGDDLVVISQTPRYQEAYERAVAEIAAREGHCADCARLGEACARCVTTTT
jgi:hypothetical protein